MVVPRIKESRGDPGTPPCGFLLEGEARGGPIYPQKLAAEITVGRLKEGGRPAHQVGSLWARRTTLLETALRA
jgi:hypothetical protein